MTIENTTSQASTATLTGRDDYIQAQALIYAIACIQNLPEDQQEWSNMRDMCKIARTIEPAMLGELVFSTQRHVGTVIDIWPDRDDELSEMERREKKAFKFALNAFIEEREKMLAEFAAAHPLRQLTEQEASQLSKRLALFGNGQAA